MLLLRISLQRKCPGNVPENIAGALTIWTYSDRIFLRKSAMF